MGAWARWARGAPSPPSVPNPALLPQNTRAQPKPQASPSSLRGQGTTSARIADALVVVAGLGSYAALRGGTLPQALRSLTGSVPVRLELAPPAASPAGGRAPAPPRLSWERLLHLLASGAPVALYRNANAAEFEFEWDALSGSSLSMSRASLSPGRPPVEAAESDGGGMLRGLAYPVLQARLDGAVQSVQLSCPWGGQGNSNPNPSPNLNPDLNPNPNPNKGPPPGGSTSARCASTSTRHSRSPSPPQRRRAAPQTAPRTTGCRRADPNPDPDSDPDH